MKVIFVNGRFPSMTKRKEYEVIGVDDIKKMFTVRNDMLSQFAYPQSAFKIVEDVEDIVESVQISDSIENNEGDLVEVSEDANEILVEEGVKVEEKPVKKNVKRNRK